MAESKPRYHVFLSHNSQDKGAVEPLAVMLREKGLIPFLDKWNLVPGEPIEDALIAALDNSDSAVIFVGPGGDGPWQSEEMRDILKRAVKSHNEFRAIPVLLPNASAEALEKSFLGSRLWIEFKDVDDEDALLRLANAIQGEAYGDFKLPDEPAPYRGLERFERIENPEEDFFFGRDDEIRALVERLVKDRFVAVVGASGNGKSSLIRAGLTKQLAEELHPGIRRWQTITVEPGSAPFRALAVQVAVAAGIGVADREDWIEKSVQKWRASPDGVRNSIESLFADTKEPLLLFIDQFEELFTHGKKNEESERISRNFVASLDDLWRNGGDRVRIVVAMRADFIDRCLEIGALKELLQDRTMLVGEVGDDALREIVKEPAARVGAFLEKGLMERILTDVHNQSGSLPLLEQALYELWRERRGAWLTHDAYVASGGVAGALNDQAQGAYKALDDAQKEIADNLFPRLITLGEGVADTRRRVRRSELYPEGVEPAAVNEVIDKLSGKDARILVTTREGGTEEDIGAGEDFVEFTHEALLGNWRHLADLLTSERESIRKHRVLTTATEEWASKPEDEREKFLLRAGQLVIAEQWATNEHGYARLNQLERRFLDESIQERTAEEARKAKNARNLKRRTKIAYGFAFIAFLLMLAAWYSSNEAVKARETAEINLVSGYFKAIGETGSRGELTSVTIDTLWDIALIERDALRVMFLKHALSTNKLSKRLINQIDYVAHALVGLSVDKREMLLTQALETLKEPRSAPDVKKAAAQLCVIFIGQERIEEVVQAIVSAMNTEVDADTLSALSDALGSLADRLPEKDAAAAAQAIIGTMKHEEGHNLSYLSEALGQLAKRLNEDDAAEVAEAIVAEMKTREDAFYLSYLIEALASLEEQLPEKDTAGAVKLIVAAMKTEKDARNLSRMGTALGRLGGRLTQEDAVEGTDEIVEAMKTEEDVYNLSALSDALGSLADRLPEKDAAAAAQAIIGTMKHEEGQNLEYRSKALGQLAKRLNEDDAAEVAEAIVVEMKTREDAFDLSYLIKALASLSERLPENDVAGAVELIVAAMKAEADVGKLSAMGQALASLGQRLSQEDAVAGAELIVAAMKSEDDVYKLSNLCDALESLAGRLPEKDAADSARAMLVATMRLPDGRNLSNRNEALGSLGQRLRKEEIAKLAELIVAAMKTEKNVLKLSSMGVALGSLGQRLRKEDAAAGAQEVLQAMKIAKDTYDLWHLGEALGSLGGRLAEKDAIAGVEVIVAAMQTEIYAYNLRNLGEALGSLGEQLRKEDTTGIKHELVELLKNPEFDDRDRATILKALEKTTDELFHDEIWNLVTQTKELGLGDLNSPPTRPVIE